MRVPSIVPAIAQSVYGAIRRKAGELGCYIHAINGMEDHIHVAITIPPRYRVSTIVGQLKGFSAHFVNNEAHITEGFEWQDGFGVETVSTKDLPRIVRYIENQAQHHCERALIPELEHPGG